MVVGIDEVGRGAWAGPLVVGAVVLGDANIPGLTDSKKLSAKKRQLLAREINDQAKSIGLGWVSAEMVDRYGLTQCLKLATEQALKEVQVPYEQIIIDGTFDFLDDTRVTTMKQADLLVPSVSAASIMAKVARDYYVSTRLHEELPVYAFDKHVGYGTALHSEQLQKNGPSYAHRLSFAPVRKALGLEDLSVKTSGRTVSDTSGRKAEKVAEEYLRLQGYKVIAQNWRTKVCEIDLVVEKNDTIYCVEVKYRQSSRHGDGLAAITPKKLAQMKFAARVWQQFQREYDKDIQLAVIAVSGEVMSVDTFLELA